jgi:hypothetical protein
LFIAADDFSSPIQNTLDLVLRQLSGTSQDKEHTGHRQSVSDDQQFINTCDKMQWSDASHVTANSFSCTGDELSNIIPNDHMMNSHHIVFRSNSQVERVSLSQGKRISNSAASASWLENNSDKELIDNFGSHEHSDMSQPVGEFSKQILSAREELKRPSRVSQPNVSEIVKPVQSDDDRFWEQVALNVKVKQHPLKIGDLDFSDVGEADDEFYCDLQSHVTSSAVQNPVAASLMAVPPPPPPPPPFPPPVMTHFELNSGIPVPPALPVATPVNSNRSRKTVRLHWKEAKADLLTAGGRQADTIWDQMLREIGSVKIDGNKLEHLFETRTVDIRTRVCILLDVLC